MQTIFLGGLITLNGCGGTGVKTTQQESSPIVIIGPSTVNTDYGYSPEFHKDGSTCSIVGWGEVFQAFVNPTSKVYNYARAGASAGSFRDSPGKGWADQIQAGRTKSYNTLFGPNRDHYWAKTKEKMKALKHGILLIQFGGNDAGHLAWDIPVHEDHDQNKPILDRNNDGVGDNKDAEIAWNLRYKKFKDNLKFYVDEAKRVNFIPVFITSPNTKIIKDGKVKDNRGGYPKEMIKLAKKESIMLLDLHKKTMDKFQTNYGSQQTLDNEFGECYWSSGQRESTHYEGRRAAKVIAGWVRDLACENPDKQFCRLLKP